MDISAGYLPDRDTCYRAVRARDPRFDGWFVSAITTTGIYCRPSCPARTPRPENVEFFATAAAAQRGGYRACRRCRPDATPGSPLWQVHEDVGARALRLIGDGAIERSGVTGLGAQLGYSPRQLTRILTATVGAGPLAIARAQRAHTARILIETTSLPMTEIAYAAGFGSIRQFNDTMRAIYAATPTELRAPHHRLLVGAPASLRIHVRIPYREPFEWASLISFITARMIDGVEAWDGNRYVRVLPAPSGPAVIALSRGAGTFIDAEIELTKPADLQAVLSRIRRLVDADADPHAIDDALSRDRMLAPFVRARPGLRSPGAVDEFEMLIRAIVGQQISVAGARTVLARLVAEHGRPVISALGAFRTFPAPLDLAVAENLPMPARRASTIRTIARAYAAGTLTLNAGSHRHEARAHLQAFAGVGPWTAGYVAMRALGDPDVLLADDLWIRRHLDRRESHFPDLSPWRSYVTHHLWRAESLTRSGPGHAPAPPPANGSVSGPARKETPS